MKRTLFVAATVTVFAFGMLVAGVAAADPTLPPAPGAGPLPDPTLPVPVPTLPIPGPSDSPSPGPSGSTPPPTPLPTGPSIQCPKTTGTSILFCFTYGYDRTAWYWADQQYKNVAVGPANEQLTFPSPQSADTLPENVRQGELNRVSTMYFDLIGHGVPLGAPVTKFVLKIQEGATPTGPEQPEFNAADQVVVACPATKIWAATQADVWSAKPTWSEQGCVKGTPNTATPPVWSFDLTPLAADWATDPFAGNNGIVLVPQTTEDPQGGTYQVNFKIPSRDDSTTTDINEYDSTKDRVVVAMTYGKPTAPRPTHTHSTPPPTIPPPHTGGGGGGGGGGISTGGGGGSTCCSTGVGGGTDTGSGDTITGGSDLGGTGDTGGNTTPVTQAEPTSVPTVHFPWYVWILLPIGLLALAAVRSILFEQAHGTRPGGVIAAIRARNAAARGESATGTGGSVMDRIRRVASTTTTRRPAGS
jgi:hypothetical protein